MFAPSYLSLPPGIVPACGEEWWEHTEDGCGQERASILTAVRATPGVMVLAGGRGGDGGGGGGRARGRGGTSLSSEDFKGAGSSARVRRGAPGPRGPGGRGMPGGGGAGAEVAAANNLAYTLDPSVFHTPHSALHTPQSTLDSSTKDRGREGGAEESFDLGTKN